MIKKLLCVCLAILMSISFFSNSFAADADVPITEIEEEEYAVISNITCSISISGINSNMSAIVRAQYSTSLSTKIELQRKTGDGLKPLKNGIFFYFKRA